MSNEVVSIIVPVYKSERYLKKCIESIIKQQYKDIELILVDDGSPDNSGKICDYYARKDSRIKVIHKENGGTCDARNAGLEIVSGKYLMFVDADDWLTKDCISYLLNILKQKNAQMSMSDCVFTTRNLKQNKSDNIRLLTPEEAACEILYVKTPVGPWNKLYSTEIIKKNNLTFSVPWFGEGLWFSVMAAQLSDSVAYGHKKVYIYRKNNPNSGTTVREVQNGINSLQNIKYIKDKLIVHTQSTINAADWHIWKNNFNLIMYIIGGKAQKEYAKEYHEALKNVKKMMLNVFIKSDVGIVKKLQIIGYSLLPRTAASFGIIIKKYLLKKDTIK